MKSLSRVRLFATPWTVAYQAPPSMGFSRQEYWSGLPFPSPGDLPNPGIEPRSSALQAEVDVFLELSCFFDDPTAVCSLISDSSAFPKSSLNIWNFSVHVLLKPSLENFECYFASVWNECICEVVWTFFGIVFLWNWNENWPFPVLWPLLSFIKFAGILRQHFHNIIFWIWNSSAGISSAPLALFVVILPKAHLTSHSRMSGSRWVITPSWLSAFWL